MFLALSILCVTLLTAGALFLFNNLMLRQVNEQRTRDYLVDVSAQVASQIDARIAQSIESLNIIRDSAVLLGPEALPEFITRKESVAGFDELCLAENVEDAEAWISWRSSSLAGEDMIQPGQARLIMSREPELGIYYAAGETREDPVLLGVKSGSLLTRMLSGQSFNGEGTSRVVTRDGELLAAGESNEMSGTLRDVWENGTESEKRQLDQMSEDMHAGKAGVATVRGSNSAVMVSYIPLTANEWYVLTMIPADLLSKDVSFLVQSNLWLTVLIIAIFGGVLLTVVLLRRGYQASLEYMAFVDPVTGGMSDTRFRSEAARLLKKSSNYTLVSADMQGFKLINNIFGTEEGNRTLCHLYRTMQSCLHPGELLARASADLFYLLLEGQDREEIGRRLREMYHKANAFNQGREDPYYLELRFGADMAAPEKTDVAAMQERSSTARKTGAAVEGGCTFYDAEWQRTQLREKELVNRLDASLQAGDFRVYFQPKVRLEDRRVAGAEALIRWQHPTKGMLSPAVFVPVFEKYRLITRLDQFIFEQVCCLLARWKDEGRELCTISVNLSRQNLEIPDFLDRCRRIRDRYRVDRGLIEFELTETILLDDPDGVRRLIDRMHEAGFSCSLDDFGSGYSSLGMLNQLNVDTIKLDRSFFVGTNDSTRGRCVVESILKMAGKLHITTVAEGVDNLQQARHLRRSACDIVQGYVFFRPMPVEEFEQTAWQDGRLRCVDTEGALLDPRMQGGEGSRPASIVTFLYRPETGSIRFSDPFSPVMAGVTEYPDAAAFVRGSGVLNENDEEEFFDMLGRCARQEAPWAEGALRFCVSDGRYEWMEVHIHRENGPDGPVIRGVLVNTGSWRSEVARWKEKANRDGLTGLYNRTYFERHVRRQLAEKQSAYGALVFIDVDDFKKANDTLGHMVGDDILRCIAQRILGVFRHSDVVARYGGDEFVVFVSNMTREVLENRLDRLCTMFRNPYRNGETRYQIMGSIGASLYPADGEDYDTLLANADAALYEAKRRGKNQYRIFRVTDPQGGTLEHPPAES